MRHRRAPYLALALSLLSAPAAGARTLTIRQPGAPEVTLTVPRGWTAVERKRSLLLTRGDRRRVIRQCRLSRTERDVPPSTKTAWHVAFAHVSPRPSC